LKETGEQVGGRELQFSSFIGRLPKAELHVHLEGAVTAARFRELSQRYDTEFSGLSESQIAEELFSYSNFAEFLETFKLVCQHLRCSDDYLLVFDDLLKQFQDQNIRYAEVIYTPSIPWKYEKDGEEILRKLLKKGLQFEEEGGPKIRWILDCVRQFGPEAAMRTAQLAAETRPDGVIAIGLGGDENALPAEAYRETFAWARANELFVHVHAGEVGKPSQIWDALEILGANRIGHGIQAARDPELLEHLRARTIGLDICLTSNALTGAWRPISNNPFQLLYERGVPVTLNTDDPGLFKTTLTEEYLKAVRHFDLELSDLSHLALQGVRSSFQPYDEKMEMMQAFHGEIQDLTGQ